MFFSRNILPRFGRLCALFILLSCSNALFAQETADKIIVVLGKDIILQSELEQQVLQARQQDPKFNDKGAILQQMVLQKMMKQQAERDSVMVTDEDVEGALDNKLRYFVQVYGSKEKLEQMAGKTIYQIKEEYRDAIREQMVSEKMQNTILENIKITPAEVNAFYKRIPIDSLPFFPATVEVGQIVRDPPVSIEMNEYAHNKLEDIRKQIVTDGKSFEAMAGVYSDDPGSRDNGGRYDGITRNGPWAPEFVAATFRLQPGEISPIFKTKFGYHIVRMINRKGDEADVQHILIKPEVTSADFKNSMNTLDSIREVLVKGKMTFNEAVGKFSTDEAAKRTGGMIVDPATGVSILDMTKLDPGMVLMLDTLKEGDYSQPHIFVTDSRDRSCRIVYLRSRTGPHKANLKDDYSKIQEVALSQKKMKKVNAWAAERLQSFYIKVDPEYSDSQFLKMWQSGTVYAD